MSETSGTGRRSAIFLRRAVGALPKGSLATSSTLATMLLLNAVSGILSARLLGPSGRGVLALAFVWGALVAEVADLGVSQAVVFYSSHESATRATIWGQSLVAAAAQSAVVVPVALLAAWYLVPSESGRLEVSISLMSLPLSLGVGYQLGLLRGAQRFGLYNAIRLGQTVAWTGVVLTFTLLSVASARGLVVGYVAVLLVTFVATAFALYRLIGRPSFARRGFTILFRYGLLVWVSGIGHQASARIDQFILGSMTAVAVLGQYAAAVNLASVLTAVSMGIAVVTLPSITRAGTKQRISLGKRNWLVGVVAMSVGALVLELVAPLLVPALFGASFLPAVPLLRILLIGQVALGSTQILHEVARGKRQLKFPAIVETCGAGATIALLLYAVPRWGAVGAAWVSVAVYWPVTIVLWIGVLGGRGARIRMAHPMA